MGQLIVVRHGETDENVQSQLRGWDTSQLTPKGKQEVQAAANQLKNQPVQQIYCSDLVRAMESAQILANALQVPIKKLPQLRAWNVGQLTGQARSKHVVALKDYEANPRKTVPGGESFEDFVHRVAMGVGFVMEAAKRAPGVTVLVAHNSVITLVWKALHGEKLTVHEEIPGEGQIVPPGGLLRLQASHQGWTARKVGA